MNLFQNYFKTAMLMTLLTGLFMVLGNLIGGQGGLVLFFIIATAINFFSFFFSSKIAIRFARAEEVSESAYPEIFQDTRILAEKQGIPMPKLYISPERQPNAFATGRNPRNGVVCLTSGLLEVLGREELKGVIAHELAHIKNRDILISTIAAVIASAISMIGRNSFFGGDRENSNGALVIVALLISPIVAMLIRMAVSQSREYSADETAARSIGNSQGLINALQTISSVGKSTPMNNVNDAFASLYISNPLSGSRVKNLFSTHPPMEERIKRLSIIEF